ncbi:MAG: Fe-S-binding domain-containing protein, partial [Microthrixaceae bacterium]
MLPSILASEGGAIAASPLTVAIVVPFVGALAVALIPKGRAELHRLVALLFATGSGAISLWVLAALESGDAGLQFETNRSWVADIGISRHVGVDGISLL